MATDVFGFKPATLKKMLEMLDWWERRGPDLKGAKQGLLPLPPTSKKETISGKITGTATGGGIYVGKSRVDRTDFGTVSDATLGGSDFIESTLGALAGENDTLIFNAAECTLQSGSHFLTASLNTDQIAIDFVGRLLGITSDGTKIVEVYMPFAGCS
jgi:hypothetical protein